MVFGVSKLLKVKRICKGFRPSSKRYFYFNRLYMTLFIDGKLQKLKGIYYLTSKNCVIPMDIFTSTSRK